MKSNLRFVDIPCGAGLLSLAFMQAGYEQVLGIDIDPLRCETYQENIGKALVSDIEAVDALPHHDIFIGGIPCQPFSILRFLIRARLKGKMPKRWTHSVKVTEHVERLIALAQPTAFLTENVRWAPIPNVDGYHITPLLVHGHWIGMMQPRLRRLTFGFHKERVSGPLPPPFFPFSGSDGSDFSVLSDPRVQPVALLAGGKPKKPSMRRIKTVCAKPFVQQSTSRRTTHTPVKAYNDKNGSKRYATHSGRAGTVTGGTPVNNSPERKGRIPVVIAGHGGGEGKMAHYRRDEAENRALQGIPEDFIIVGNQDERLRAIADAVPLPMGLWAAGVLRAHLEAATLRPTVGR